MRTPRGVLADVDFVYQTMDGATHNYHERHGVNAIQILTVLDGHESRRIAKMLRARLYNRTVVEIGAGVGLLACEMARYAKRVYAIEADPAWSWVFTKHLYEHKPANLTWIFGTAESVADWLKADLAVIVSRSGLPSMRAVAERMAPQTVSLYEPAWLAATPGTRSVPR